jgi:hypothetical protein
LPFRRTWFTPLPFRRTWFTPLSFRRTWFTPYPSEEPGSRGEPGSSEG